MNYRTRIYENKLNEYSKLFKIILLVGARQVGKSTLLTKLFPNIKVFVFILFFLNYQVQMPISFTQYRVTTENYQNQLYRRHNFHKKIHEKSLEIIKNKGLRNFILKALLFVLTIIFIMFIDWFGCTIMGSSLLVVLTILIWIALITVLRT